MTALLASHGEPADPRLVAEALSDGLNLFTLLGEAAAIAKPDPQWGVTLDSFANAFEAVQRGWVRTDMQVGSEDVERARQLAARVKEWIDTEQRDDETSAKLALALLSAFQ